MKSKLNRTPEYFTKFIIIWLIIFTFVFTFLPAQASNAQYGNYFDIERTETHIYYLGSNEHIKIKDLIIGYNYSLNIENDLPTKWTALHSNADIEFSSQGNSTDPTDHLTFLLYENDILIDTYEIEVRGIIEQMQIVPIVDLFTEYFTLIIFFSFMILLIYLVK